MPEGVFSSSDLRLHCASPTHAALNSRYQALARMHCHVRRVLCACAWPGRQAAAGLSRTGSLLCFLSTRGIDQTHRLRSRGALGLLLRSGEGTLASCPWCPLTHIFARVIVVGTVVVCGCAAMPVFAPSTSYLSVLGDSRRVCPQHLVPVGAGGFEACLPPAPCTVGAGSEAELKSRFGAVLIYNL